MASRTRRTARGNRWGLLTTGLVLLVLGAGALAQGFGGGLLGLPWFAPPDAMLRIAAGWPLTPWVVAAVALAVLLLSLRWLLVQGRTGAVGRVRLRGDPRDGVTEVSSGAVGEALTRDVADYPGVRRASAHVQEDRFSPQVTVDVVLEEDADAAAVWRRCDAEALPRLRRALESRHLPAVVRMSVAPPPRHRVRRLD